MECMYICMYLHPCLHLLQDNFTNTIIIIIIKSIIPSRNIGCLWVLSTSVYRLLRTLVHSSFYPLPWLPIFSSCFSVFLSSCFPEGSRYSPMILFNWASLPFWYKCSDTILSYSCLHSRALVRQQIVSPAFLSHRLIENSRISAQAGC